MNFGEAIQGIKEGRTFARKGWLTKKMCISINRGSQDFTDYQMEVLKTIAGISIDLFERGDIGTVTRLPNIWMRDGNGSIVLGYVATQNDMLAEDWEECAPDGLESF